MVCDSWRHQLCPAKTCRGCFLDDNSRHLSHVGRWPGLCRGGLGWDKTGLCPAEGCCYPKWQWTRVGWVLLVMLFIVLKNIYSFRTFVEICCTIQLALIAIWKLTAMIKMPTDGLWWLQLTDNCKDYNCNSKLCKDRNSAFNCKDCNSAFNWDDHNSLNSASIAKIVIQHSIAMITIQHSIAMITIQHSIAKIAIQHSIAKIAIQHSIANIAIQHSLVDCKNRNRIGDCKDQNSIFKCVHTATCQFIFQTWLILK